MLSANCLIPQQIVLISRPAAVLFRKVHVPLVLCPICDQ